MLGGITQSNWATSIPDEERGRIEKLVKLAGEQFGELVGQYGLPHSQINGTIPSNVVVVLDREKLHVVFEKTSNPVATYNLVHFPDRVVTSTDVGAAAYRDLGFQFPSAMSMNKAVTALPEIEQRNVLRELATRILTEKKAEMGKPKALAGFESLQPLLNAFSNDHPNFEKNVFVAMRFADTPQNKEIWQAIEDTLKRYGMKAQRADAKSYPQDDDLWNNVCIYMMGCKYGICVFDQVDERNFNPNVQIEYGFMRASDKRVLLLKDQRQPTMPVDITGKIRREFDTYSITATVSARVSDWLEKDLGLKPIP